ncbi:unnamed protein product [Mucor hiemalis]
MVTTTFIVRHGERLGKKLTQTVSFCSFFIHLKIDHIDKSWQSDPSLGIWDPPITPKGHRQAELTGKEIANMMSQQNIRNPKIVVYSSPFQRCVDTSIGILKGIQKEQRKSTCLPVLKLDIGLGEWMCERFFDSICSAQHLLSRQQEKLARKQAHSYSMMAKKSPQESPLPSLTIDYAYSNNTIHEFNYPERYTDMIHRFEETRLNCLESALRTKFKKTTKEEEGEDQQQPTVVIFVTHAVGVNALLDGFRDRVTIPLESNYCSISCVRRYQSANAAAAAAIEYSDQSDEDCEFIEEGSFHSPSKPKWIIDTVMFSDHLTC